MGGLSGGDESVGDDIQFEKKELTLAEKYALYNQTVAQIASYLELGGMFEMKDGQTYSIFNNSNEDAFTWKQYDLAASLYYNAHEMQEVKFNVSDAVLLGSTSSVEKLPEIISRFRVNLNMQKLYYDAYFKGCLEYDACKAIVKMTPDDIFNAHYRVIYDKNANEAMTNEEWEKAHE